MFAKTDDPVCGMKVRKREATTSVVHGKKYFFCSEACKAKFEEDPEKYLKPAGESK